MSVGSVYRHVSLPFFCSARVVVNVNVGEKKRKRERERERSWFWKKGAEVSSSSSSLQRERDERNEDFSVLLFPEKVCGYSSLELKQGKNAFAITSRARCQ